MPIETVVPPDQAVVPATQIPFENVSGSAKYSVVNAPAELVLVLTDTGITTSGDVVDSVTLELLATLKICRYAGLALVLQIEMPRRAPPAALIDWHWRS